MTFELQYTDSKTNARAGLITTDHGQIETPIFMPVGTVGTVKGVHIGKHLSSLFASGIGCD